MDGRAKPGHDGGGQSMRELKRLLFRGSLAEPENAGLITRRQRFTRGRKHANEYDFLGLVRKLKALPLRTSVPSGGEVERFPRLWIL